MGALFAILIVVAAWDVAKTAIRHQAADYRQARNSSTGQADRAAAARLRGRDLRAAQRRAAGYWARELLHGFPVARTGWHAGWLAHRSARDRQRRAREGARTEHLETRASWLAALREHRQRQARAQAEIDAALAAVPEPARGRRAVQEAVDEIAWKRAEKQQGRAAPPLPADSVRPVPDPSARHARRPDGRAERDAAADDDRTEAPADSGWLAPGERGCEGCVGRGVLPDGTTCPACQDRDSAPPDQDAHAHAAEQQTALSSMNSGVQQAAGEGDRQAPAAGPPPADLPPGACRCGMPACRSGWPVTATTRRDGPAAPTGSGPPAGEPDRNGSNGGNQMTTGTVPSGELTGDSPYRSALTAMDGYDQIAQQHEQAAETLEAQLTLHGFDRDQGLMEHIRALRETAAQIRAHTAGARQVLVDHHATGDEYHTSGVDAEASAFRH